MSDIEIGMLLERLSAQLAGLERAVGDLYKWKNELEHPELIKREKPK